MKSRVLFVVLVVAVAATALMPTVSQANPPFRYVVPALNTTTTVSVYGLDKSQNSTIRIMRGGVEQDRSDRGSGNSAISFYTPVNPGDVIEIYQPQAATPTPLTPPTDTFAVPDLTISATAGAASVTGTAPAGWNVFVRRDRACNGPNDALPASAGAYSVAFGSPAAAGEEFSVTAVSPNGDRIGDDWPGVRIRIPGDAGCVYVDAQTGFDPFDETPYRVSTWGLDTSVITTTRIVLRRGDTVLGEKNGGTSVDLPPSVKPMPGDVVDVYRPKDAASPAYSWTIPPVYGVFDPGNELVAIDGPASSETGVSPCRRFVCGYSPNREAVDIPAGRTIFSFAAPQGSERTYDLTPETIVSAWWYDAGHQHEFDFDVAVGDLTSPIGRITLARKLTLGRLGKKLKVKLNSSEAGNAVAKLTTTPAGRRSGRASAAAKKPVTIASARQVIAAGNNKLTLRVTKKGAKALKTLLKNRKSQSATLTVTLTDNAGNVTTVVKNTKLTAGRR